MNEATTPDGLRVYRHRIAGRTVAGLDGRTFASINPTTGASWAEFPDGSAEDVDRAMAFNSPFGGCKQSGIGRHNGLEAIDHYRQTKSVWCELSGEVQDPFVLRT